MPEFNIQNLFLLYLLSNIFIITLFAIYFLYYQLPNQKLKLYTTGRFFQLGTWSIFLWNYNFTNIYLSAIANILFIISLTIEIYILLSANNEIKKKDNIILISFSVLASLTLLSSIFVSSYYKVLYMSIFISLYFLFLSKKFAFWTNKTKIEHIVGFWSFIISILFIIRALYSLFILYEQEIFSNNFISLISYLGYFSIIYTLPIIYLFILKERNEKIILESKKKIEEDNKKLKELNDTKDKILSIIGHDLRNPIGAIMGFSDLISEKCKNKEFDKIEEYTYIINQAAEQSFEVLNNMLYWAKIQNNRIRYKKSYIDFNSFIQDVCKLMQANMKAKDLKIQKIVEPDFHFVADKLLLEIIMRNLLSNAIKYTKPDGSITLIAFKTETEIKIQVKDTGIGISSESIEKILKSENGTSTLGTNQEKGTGLGLLLCREFTEIQNGKISIQSKENQGSTFTISLPITEID